MLRELLERAGRPAIRYLELTVTPSNIGSRSLFTSFAEDLRAPVAKSTLFEQSLFDDSDHEPELLLRIGPIQQT